MRKLNGTHNPASDLFPPYNPSFKSRLHLVFRFALYFSVLMDNKILAPRVYVLQLGRDNMKKGGEGDKAITYSYGNFGNVPFYTEWSSFVLE